MDGYTATKYDSGLIKMWLVTSDIHLSDRARDSYRFGLFRWLAKQQKQHNVSATFILGDLTQEKDYHSASLVNRAIDEMTRLRPPVYFLRGNHDGTDPNNPFFQFIDCIDGFSFGNDPHFNSQLGVVFIPHCRTQSEFDDAVKVIKGQTATVMCHQTFEGAIAETGVKLNGLSTKTLALSKPKLVLAGDVHKPQHQGIVHYVGAPYHVRFGDDFEPRVLLIDGTQMTDLHFDAPRKWVIRTNKAYRLPDHVREGDQVKVYVELGREEAVHWHHHRRAMLGLCRDVGLEVFGIDMKIQGNGKTEGTKGHQLQTPKDVFTAFCQHEGLRNGLRTTGFRLLTADGAASQAA